MFYCFDILIINDEFKFQSEFYNILNFKLMRTQIIKLDSVKASIKEGLNKLAKKFNNKNAEITIIVKTPENDQSKVSIPSSSHILTSTSNLPNTQKHLTSRKNVEKTLRESTGKIVEDSREQDIQMQICISNHDIMPNVTINSVNRKEKIDGKNRRISLDTLNLPIWSANNGVGQMEKIEQKQEQTGVQEVKQGVQEIRKIAKRQKPEYSDKSSSKRSKFKENEISSSKQINRSIPKNDILRSETGKQIYQSKKEEKISEGHDKNYSERVIFSNFQQSEEEESLVESFFIIENKLNDAIKFIETNQIFELEEFLYQFKTKYKNISERIQIKWRLLMAHCKESRKEYERASILYSQVLELASCSPKALLIDTADINHRLAICYTEIRKWNEGIMAFVKALNELKSKGKTRKYAQCMNNLGTLYLYAEIMEQAQKCFLVSYRIKREQFPANSKNLISTLLNLYQCNLSTHNYIQAEDVLATAEKCASQIKNSDMISGALERRRGKLHFLKGNLEEAAACYSKAYERLHQKYPYCLELGQLMNNIGVLKLQLEELAQAKRLFDQAIIILNLYYTKDSIYAQTAKKNVELANSLIKKGKQLNITFGDRRSQQLAFMNLLGPQNGVR